MSEAHDGNSRHTVVWPEAARDIVRVSKGATGAAFQALIDRLVKETGNSRKACHRFVRRMGVRWKRPRKRWTERELERLKKQLEKCSVSEIARNLQRSESSIWHMMQRLGLSAQIGRDCFTKYTLARALHVRVDKVEDWIAVGRLPAREVDQGGIKKVIIEGEDFVHFCRKYTKEVVGDDLPIERLEFVCRYAFPPSHEGLLQVRASKREREAFRVQSEGQNQETKPSLADDADKDETSLGATA